MIGILVLGFFLVFIGVLNLIILIFLINLFVKLCCEYIEEVEVDVLFEFRGLVFWFVGFYFKLIMCSWYVLLFGFLFGFGFDIVSEIVLFVFFLGVL